MRTTAPFFLSGALAIATGGCDKNPLAQVDCDIAGDRIGDFGDGAAALKLEAFLHATHELYHAAQDIEEGLGDACRAIGTDLDVPAAEMPAGDARATCQRVSNEIRSILETNLPVGARLTIAYSPPVCSVDLSATGSCYARCDASLMGTPPTVTCDPGHLYGECSGSCSGECRGSCEGGCTGTCYASCTGSCEGTCRGACEGTCSAMNAGGECEGTCDGECAGSCSGTCTGGCSGRCHGSCEASCTGECHGSCSVVFEAPRCDAEPGEVSADVDCQAACNAEAKFSATCTEPDVLVDWSAEVDEAARARIEALVATLRANLPAFLKEAARLGENFTSALADFRTSLTGLGGAVADVGIGAVACVGDAVEVFGEAFASVNVSVSVSVEVQASVGASGMAGGGT